MSRKQSFDTDCTIPIRISYCQRSMNELQQNKKYHQDFDKYKSPGQTKSSSEMSLLSTATDFSSIRKLPENISSIRETFSFNPVNYSREDTDKPVKSKNQRLKELMNMALDLKIVKKQEIQNIAQCIPTIPAKPIFDSFSRSDNSLGQKMYQSSKLSKYKENSNQIKSYNFLSKPYNYDKSHSVTVEQEIQKLREQNLMLKSSRSRNSIEGQSITFSKSPYSQRPKECFYKKNCFQYYSPKVEKSFLKELDGANTLSPPYERKKETSFETRFQSPPKSQVKKIPQSYPQIQKQPKPVLDKIKIDDFHILKNIGKGRFGLVLLAFHKLTGSIFAIKKIKKQIVKTNKMIDQFVLEVKLQIYLSHPFVLKIYGVFDDDQHIYLIMEYLQQGCLFNYLKNSKNKKLSEPDTAYKIKYLAESIKYLQEQSIAHRDIKPQNIIMSHDVCKLADFGWATFCDQERRKTYCGTCDYVAPEILEGQGYDQTVDLWCIGVLAYELVAGKAPFYHMSQKQTRNKILNANLTFPEEFSQNLKSFISGLIQKDPEKRMSIGQVLRHPFLKEVNLCE